MITHLGPGTPWASGRGTGHDASARWRALVESLMALDRERDPYTATHQERVGRIAREVGMALGLQGHRLLGLEFGAMLHDTGKSAIPESILHHRGALSMEQFAIIKRHSQAGCEFLSRFDFPWSIATMALQHHEWFDGTGYPNALRGDDILLEARIIAVADMIDATTSDRPYRAAPGIAHCVREIVRGAGTQFDPRVAQAALTAGIPSLIHAARNGV